MPSDEAWEAGHRAARVPMNIGGVVLFIAGILIIALPLSGVIVGVSMGVMLLLSLKVSPRSWAYC